MRSVAKRPMKKQTKKKVEVGGVVRGVRENASYSLACQQVSGNVNQVRCGEVKRKIALSYFVVLDSVFVHRVHGCWKRREIFVYTKKNIQTNIQINTYTNKHIHKQTHTQTNTYTNKHIHK